MATQHSQLPDSLACLTAQPRLGRKSAWPFPPGMIGHLGDAVVLPFVFVVLVVVLGLFHRYVDLGRARSSKRLLVSGERRHTVP
jgi:hypothetical protein